MQTGHSRVDWRREAQTQADTLAREVAESPLKVEVAKDEGVADFRRSTEYKKEILEAGWGEFMKLLVAVVKGLLAHKSLEVVIHAVPQSRTNPKPQCIGRGSNA